MRLIAVRKAWVRSTARLVILAALAVVSGCTGGDGSGDGAPAAAPASTPAPGAGSAGSTAGAGAPNANPGSVRIDPNPAPSPLVAAPPLAPAVAQPSGAMQPAPGSMSLRFIVRKRETGEELPAGGFDVRLLSLDSVREGGATAGSAPAPTPAGTAPGTPSGGAAAAPYRGKPEQVLVTQLDGAKWTFLAGVRPGTYALRITAPRRKMLLEVITVKTTDRSVERSLEPE